MGKHFGNLQRLYGVTYYVLSPNELNPFKGFLNPGIRHNIRKLFECGTPFVIGAACLYVIHHETMRRYHEINRKNPDLYKDEV